MKKLKSVIASLLICSLLISGAGLIWASSNGGNELTLAMEFTIQHEPKPVSH